MLKVSTNARNTYVRRKHMVEAKETCAIMIMRAVLD